MAHSSVKNQNGFSCYFLITPLANAVRRLAAIELLSLIYAMWVFFTLKSAWLALAKYHGFAINLCLVLLIFPVLRNLKSIIVDCQSFPFPLMRKLSRRLSRLASCTRGKRHVRSPYCLPDHEFYSYRLLFSSLVHTLVHVLQTHPFNSANFSNFQRRYTGLFARLSATVSPPDLTQQAPINTSLLQPLNTTEMTKNASSFINVADFTETLLVYDRWTVSGYLLLLFFISELALGMRLMRFLVKHVYVLLVHRIINILITFVFLPAHHSNYFFILLPTLLFIVDYLIGAFVLTHSTKVRRVVIYPSFTSALPTTVTELSDEILEIDFDVISNRFAHSCQPGDYIAVKIPKISRWQWHHFTIMKHSGFSDSENSGTSQHNLRGVAVVRRKILIRCLGKWTYAILDHRDNNDLSMVIKGPYRSGQACSVKDLLARPFDRLVFMSTGTSITSHLSLLNGLIDEYWLRQTTTIATRHFYSSPARFNLPREIRLVWIVRYSTDVNFAISTLNDMQLLLARRGMDGLLTYDIWITREPTLNERELNTRLQACLVSSKTRSDVDYDVQKAKSNDSYADITKIHRRNQIVSLEHGMHDVSQQFAFSLGSNEPVSDNRGAESSTSAGMFDFFYSHAQMHTGIRPSWNKLRIMCAASTNTLDPNEAKDYPVPSTLSSSVITVKSIDPKPTLVLLNTSVGRLRVDVERLAASHGFDLLTDDFWS